MWGTSHRSAPLLCYSITSAVESSMARLRETPVKTNSIAIAAALATLFAASAALAQKEAMSMFYQMKLAPTVCQWKDAPSSAKLDATIAAQESGLKVSASERAAMMKQAETEIKADATACAPDGMLRLMYNEAVK